MTSRGRGTRNEGDARLNGHGNATRQVNTPFLLATELNLYGIKILVVVVQLQNKDNFQEYNSVSLFEGNRTCLNRPQTCLFICGMLRLQFKPAGRLPYTPCTFFPGHFKHTHIRLKVSGDNLMLLIEQEATPFSSVCCHRQSGQNLSGIYCVTYSVGEH